MNRPDALAELCSHLRATETLPVDRTAGRWLGEAQAVACDLADAADADGDGGPDEATVRDRVETVRRLLEAVDSTGSEAADEHVAAAEALVAELLAE